MRLKATRASLPLCSQTTKNCWFASIHATRAAKWSPSPEDSKRALGFLLYLPLPLRLSSDAQTSDVGGSSRLQTTSTLPVLGSTAIAGPEFNPLAPLESRRF